ncbi:HEPN domain protein [archaeon BMS3Bbin16]|nr:HEPN domain protein [archaeon BMS3Bbin16]
MSTEHAAYHGVKALLTSGGVNPKTHKGVLNQFGEVFVKTGKMDISMSDTLRRCFDARHEADYDVFASFNEDEVETLISDAQALLEEIRQYLS